VKEMREERAGEYADFTWAFSGGRVKCEWVFETLGGLKWTSAGAKPGWGCQPRAIAGQIEAALAKYRDEGIDMWVFCAGQPVTLNGDGKQKVTGPPYGISYTQWQLHGGYSIAICAPHLPLIVHEINHRYLDNLATIEGVQLTLFHGLNQMGYETGDLGYPDLLAVYRSVYLHLIRPAMWDRFNLTGPPSAKAAIFTGERRPWKEVSDDAWFRLPLLGEKEIAKLTGLPSLRLVAPKETRWRHFTVSPADRARLRSPVADAPGESDTAPNNLLSLATESCAVLATETGHWLMVRPEVADVYAAIAPEAAGWINEGVRPLVMLRADPALPVPAREIGYFR